MLKEIIKKAGAKLLSRDMMLYQNEDKKSSSFNDEIFPMHGSPYIYIIPRFNILVRTQKFQQVNIKYLKK